MNKRKRGGWVFSVAVSLLVVIKVALCLVIPQAVNAATFTVNSTADALDTKPGDGVCETAAGNGECTLRGAIQEANALLGDDSIILPAGTYLLTIHGANEDDTARGDLDITDDLTINGAGASVTIVDGGGVDRVFHLTVNFNELCTVTVTGVTIRNGNAGSSNRGGGGILNDFCTLTITDSIISGNVDDNEGGGILNQQGILTMENSTVSQNRAGYGGGFFNNGGTMLFLNSSISQNEAEIGGGIFEDGSGTTITNSTIGKNRATEGGGICFDSSDTTITNSTIFGNVGGNICFVAFGGVTLQNSILGEQVEECLVGVSPGVVPLTSLGNNLFGDPFNCNITFVESDLTGSAGLGTFIDGGMPGNGHFPLLSDSPAIDVGSDEACPDRDQIGHLRPQDGNSDGVKSCDIGAVELSRSVFVWVMNDGGNIGDPYLTKMNTDGLVWWRVQMGQSLAIGVDPRDGSVWAPEQYDNRGNFDQVVHFGVNGDIVKQKRVCTNSILGVDQNDGSVWVGCPNEDKVVKLDSEGRELFSAPGFEAPASIAVDPRDSAVWIADGGGAAGRKVVKLDKDGQVLVVRERQGFFSNSPQQIAVNPNDGSVWYTTLFGTVFKLSSDGNLLKQIGGFDRPTSVSVDPRDGSVWVSDFSVKSRGAVVKIANEGKVFFRKPLDFPPRVVSVNPEDGSVWVGMEGSLVKLSSTGKIDKKVSIDGVPKAIVTEIVPSESTTVVNNQVSLDPGVDIVYDPTLVPGAPAGLFTITATFTNTSSTPLEKPFFQIRELSGWNVLLNADEAPGRVGARLTPSLGGDELLSPGELITVTFVIGLQTTEPFSFLFDLVRVP